MLQMEKLNIIPVSNDEALRNYWPLVRDGLFKVLSKMPHEVWMPEDVWTAIKNGKATLLVGETLDGTFAGFAVFNLYQGADGKSAFIWAIYNATEHGALFHDAERIWEWVRSTGAERVEMISSRPGWFRVGAALGFKPVKTLYQLDL